MFQHRRLLTICSALCGISLLLSCKKDPPVYPSGSNQAINQWIHTEMDQYYYWREQLPRSSDVAAAPTAFFGSLLASEDRFSAIMQSLNTSTFGNSLTSTFGFDLMTLERNGATLHLINHVVPQSSGDRAGLQRGDSISAIDGQMLTTQNVAAIVVQSLRKNQVQLSLANGSNFTLPSSFISQRVLYTHRIFNDRNRTAYLFLSHFDFSGAYDLLSAVRSMREAAVEELILDLRYNPGGQMSFAAFCALLLVPVRASDIFVRYRGNRNMDALDESFEAALARQPDGYSFTVSELLATRLSLKRIYILTSAHTASAAEVLTNNLKPYIDVVHIGETTMGKDMASVTRSSPDEVTGNAARWHILPLVYKIQNSDGRGDYSTGLVPAYSATEYDSFVLYPFGDTRDPLIAKALSLQQAPISNSFMKATTAKGKLRFESLRYQARPILLD